MTFDNFGRLVQIFNVSQIVCGQNIRRKRLSRGTPVFEKCIQPAIFAIQIAVFAIKMAILKVVFLQKSVVCVLMCIFLRYFRSLKVI